MTLRTSRLNEIILLVFILITSSIYIIIKYHKPRLTINTIDNFVNIGKLESDMGNLEITDASCEKPENPAYVGKNYSVCCNKLSEGCICKFKSMNKCKAEYDKCFDNKTQSFKKERENKLQNINKLETEITTLKTELTKIKHPFLIKPIQKRIDDKETLLGVLQEEVEIEPSIPPGVRQQCQNDFSKCAKNNITNLNKSKYNTDKYELVKMKQGSGKNICSLNLNNLDELPLCINYCNNLEGCNGGVYNKVSGICDLYTDLIDVDPGMARGDVNFQAFIKKDYNLEEAFTSKQNKTQKILNKLNKNNNKCNTTYNREQLQYLRNTYGFNKLELNNDIVPPNMNSEICNIKGVSFTKCKDSCLMNEGCDYLMYGNDSNLTELKDTKYELNNNKCILYNGIPNLDGETVSLSKVNKGGNYYIKKLLPMDERDYD